MFCACFVFRLLGFGVCGLVLHLDCCYLQVSHAWVLLDVLGLCLSLICTCRAFEGWFVLMVLHFGIWFCFVLGFGFSEGFVCFVFIFCVL